MRRARSAGWPRTRRNWLPRPHVEMLEGRQLLATITVNTAADDNSQSDTTLSLREAIEISNGTLAISSLSQAEQVQVSGALSNPNTIDFNIPGMGPFTIAPADPLPTVTAPVVIDGYSQPGSKMNDQANGEDASLLIVLSGASGGSFGQFNGLTIISGHSTVEGLVISQFTGDGIELSAAGGNVIQGNFIGTDASGAQFEGNGGDGVAIDAGSAGNTLGGTTPAARNVIDGSLAGGSCLAISEAGTTGNVVQGNFIGTDAAGTSALAGNSAGNGVTINDAAANTIGGTSAGAGNVISAAGAGSGIQISSSAVQSPPGGGSTSSGSLTLTQTAVSAGFNLTTFASGFPSRSDGLGPFGVAFPSTGGVLVTDDGPAGDVRRFPTDTDGQSASNVTPVTYGQPNLSGLAKLGNTIYMTQAQLNDVAQLNDDGTLNHVVATNITNADGITPDPLNGHLFVSEYDGPIVEIDPVAGTSTVFANVNADGLDFDPITNTLYAALYSGAGGPNNEIQGFNVATKAVVFDSGTVAGRPDGVVLGSGILAGNLFANTNSGTIVEINLATKAQTLIATSGSRGDFVTGDPNNGTLLVSQTDRLARLFPPAGGAFVGNQGAAGNVVQGNFIGANQAGAALRSNGAFDGILIANASGNLVGGTASGAGNTIAFNSGVGVQVLGTGNAIEGNSIHDNAKLGIKLGAATQYVYSPTPNSPGGPHVGPNDLQNYPVLSSASFDPTSGITTIQGTLNSTPNSTFRIEFFAGPKADPSGHGPGQTFLGALSAASPNPVTTDNNGNASFTFTTTAGNLAGQSISVTATDPSGNTSEFAADVVVRAATAPDLGLVGHAPAVVTLGQTVTDTLKVTNNGTGAATGVTLTDTLPAAVSFVSATGGVSPVSGVLDFDIGNLAAGASTSFTIVVTPTAAGSLVDRARVSMSQIDPTPGDNNLSLGTQVKTAPSSGGPVVTGVQRLGFHAQPTRLVLSFNEPLDAPTAQNAGNYQIVSMGRTGSGSGPDPLVRVKQALYDASTDTVTLIPVERLNLHDLFRLTVIGTGPGGVTDASGNLLDSDGGGGPGSNYVTTVSARNLVLTTTNPTIVAKYRKMLSQQAPFLRLAVSRGSAARRP
jgi:uncharacterized repeat protein (TIGR01451 family)/CSLREA domain-containing protein